MDSTYSHLVTFIDEYFQNKLPTDLNSIIAEYLTLSLIEPWTLHYPVDFVENSNYEISMESTSNKNAVISNYEGKQFHILTGQKYKYFMSVTGPRDRKIVTFSLIKENYEYVLLYDGMFNLNARSLLEMMKPLEFLYYEWYKLTLCYLAELKRREEILLLRLDKTIKELKITTLNLSRIWEGILICEFAVINYIKGYYNDMLFLPISTYIIKFINDSTYQITEDYNDQIKSRRICHMQICKDDKLWRSLLMILKQIKMFGKFTGKANYPTRKSEGHGTG